MWNNSKISKSYILLLLFLISNIVGGEVKKERSKIGFHLERDQNNRECWVKDKKSQNSTLWDKPLQRQSSLPKLNEITSNSKDILTLIPNIEKSYKFKLPIDIYQKDERKKNITGIIAGASVLLLVFLGIPIALLINSNSSFPAAILYFFIIVANIFSIINFYYLKIEGKENVKNKFFSYLGFAFLWLEILVIILGAIFIGSLGE